jgi:hypothetical protein
LKMKLLNVVREFDSNGLDYVILNGFAFAEERLALQNNVSIFNNLDIMIRREEFGRIEKFFQTINFIANKKTTLTKNRRYESGDNDIIKQGISFSKRTGVISLKLTVHLELRAESYASPANKR